MASYPDKKVKMTRKSTAEGDVGAGISSAKSGSTRKMGIAGDGQSLLSKTASTSALPPLGRKEVASDGRLRTPSKPRLPPNSSLPLLSKPVSQGQPLGRTERRFLKNRKAFELVNQDLELSSSCEGTGTAVSSTEASLTLSTTTISPSAEDTPTSTETEEDNWKGDLTKLTRIKIASKINIPINSDGDTLQLRYKEPIWPHQASLSQTLSRLHNVTCLVLDGSELRSLRDLGSSLSNLVTLSVAKCGLVSLDGTMGFTSLRTLVASTNELETPAHCAFLSELVHLDLSSNPIADIRPFMHLKACSKLKSLKLYDTPVSQVEGFYGKMKSYIPSLKLLRPVADITVLNPGMKKTFEDSYSQDILKREFDVLYRKNFAMHIPPQSGTSSRGNLETGSSSASASRVNLETVKEEEELKKTEEQEPDLEATGDSFIHPGKNFPMPMTAEELEDTDSDTTEDEEMEDEAQAQEIVGEKEIHPEHFFGVGDGVEESEFDAIPSTEDFTRMS